VVARVPADMVGARIRINGKPRDDPHWVDAEAVFADIRLPDSAGGRADDALNGAERPRIDRGLGRGDELKERQGFSRGDGTAEVDLPCRIATPVVADDDEDENKTEVIAWLG